MKPIWEVAADIAAKVPQEEWDKMAKPTKCECRACLDHDVPFRMWVRRCDRCKKRDELWNELVSKLKWHSGNEELALLARAKKVT